MRFLKSQSNFHSPHSNFYVGAIAVGDSGNFYFGANMEFVGVPLSASIHAEQSAVMNAWIHGEGHSSAARFRITMWSLQTVSTRALQRTYATSNYF